jgi:hypothetical protein
MLMPLKTYVGPSKISGAKTIQLAEALASGNSRFSVDGEWLDPKLAGLANIEEVENWWLTMVEGMGAGDALARRGLDLKTDTDAQPDLTAAVVDLRVDIKSKLREHGFATEIQPFEAGAYNPEIPLLDNLLFAMPVAPMSQAEIAENKGFLKYLQVTELTDDFCEIACAVTDLLDQTFGTDGTDHPLFQRLGIERGAFKASVKIKNRVEGSGRKGLSDADLAMLLALPCVVGANQVGFIVPERLQQRIVAARDLAADNLRNELFKAYQPLGVGKYATGLSIFENAIFGRLTRGNSARGEEARKIVMQALEGRNLKRKLATLTFDEPTTAGGANLPAQFAERIAFIRAAVKRPDILVLNKVLASYDEETRFAASIRLRQELPDATIIYLEDSFRHPENFDLHVELQQGKISLTAPDETPETSQPGSSADFATKLQALEQAEFFRGLDRQQMRLMAFSAQWFSAPAGTIVFNKNDSPSDGVYLILEGEAEFFAPADGSEERRIRTVGHGSLVGELALILNKPRTLSMRAHTDLRGLRIGAEEFLAVVQNDAPTAFRLLQVLSEYLSRPAG